MYLLMRSLKLVSQKCLDSSGQAEDRSRKDKLRLFACRELFYSRIHGQGDDDDEKALLLIQLLGRVHLYQPNYKA